MVSHGLILRNVNWLSPRAFGDRDDPIKVILDQDAMPILEQSAHIPPALTQVTNRTL
jgi:hypothetical protein